MDETIKQSKTASYKIQFLNFNLVICCLLLANKFNGLYYLLFLSNRLLRLQL